MLQTSEDGWNCATPLTALTDDRDAMLAVAMNGRPLPIEHGFPVRSIVPGLYGYVSATKWVVDFEVTRFEDVAAFWTQRGWSEQGPVKIASRIDVPRSGADVDPGRLDVGGLAWKQHTGIAAVEVALDGGAWERVAARRGAHATTPGCSGPAPSTSRPATTPCACGRSVATATCRPARSRTSYPTVRRAGTPWTSASATRMSVSG